MLGSDNNNVLNMVNIGKDLQQGAQVTEFEMLLEQERKKNKEIKEKLESDFKSEKKTRVEYENRLVQLKNESMKRDQEFTELDYKYTNLT